VILVGFLQAKTLKVKRFGGGLHIYLSKKDFKEGDLVSIILEKDKEDNPLTFDEAVKKIIYKEVVDGALVKNSGY
jgi:hypothetical protein